MTFEQAYVFGVLGATRCLFIWDRWRYDVVSVLALPAVAISGIIDIGGVFARFGHPAVITVTAVLAISKTLQGSSLIGNVGSFLARTELGPSVQVALIAAIVGALSGFMNNVGALALLLPIVLQMAKRSGRSPRSLLTPLSFGWDGDNDRQAAKYYPRGLSRRYDGHRVLRVRLHPGRFDFGGGRQFLRLSHTYLPPIQYPGDGAWRL